MHTFTKHHDESDQSDVVLLHSYKKRCLQPRQVTETKDERLTDSCGEISVRNNGAALVLNTEARTIILF